MMRLSVSKVTTYLNCPAQYAYQYEWKVPAKRKASLTKGVAVHAAAETALRAKQAGSLDPAAALAAHDTIFWQEALDTDWQDATAETIHSESRALAQAYLEQILPRIEPVQIEEWITYTVAGVEFLGKMDVIDTDGAIRDLKTATKRPNQEQLDRNLQASAYALAYRQTLGVREGAIIFDYLIPQKKGIVAESYLTTRNDAHLYQLERVVDGVANAIAQGHFYPNYTSPFCTPASCAFYARCHADHGVPLTEEMMVHAQ